MKWLEKLAALVDSQKADGGGARSWWRWPLLILVVLVGVASAAWVSWRQRKELAKLRHEQFKREVEANAVTVRLLEAETKDTRLALKIELDRVAAEVDDLEAEIAKVTCARAERIAVVDRLDWRDLKRSSR